MSEFDGQCTTNWGAAFAERTTRMRSSIIRELLQLTQRPGMISFAGGLPAPEMFPVRDLREACEFVLTEVPDRALQYGPTQGVSGLLEYLAAQGQKYGVPSQAENILITNGSQQALDLIGRVFINPGDNIMTERPTYLGAIQAWGVYGPNFVTVPLDDQGMQVDIAEQILQETKVKFIYVLPNFHNPAGTTMPLDRRERLVRLAAKHNAFIIEDDPYGELRFEGEDIPPIVSLHKENVIYLSTFSKTLAPGLRLGWISGPSEIIGRLSQAKQGTDLHTSTFTQYVAYDICERGLIRSHVRKIRAEYRLRRDVMLEAIAEHFPEGASWARPQGGLFLWVRLPESVDVEPLFHIALEEQVAFVPGYVFYPDGGGRHSMRLNFSCMGPPQIREGIARLGRAIRRQIAAHE
ncbi:MAG: PLP-dependent aminotransferase family protein [Anaerolineae bacterium]|nr:PLP-dependent aminotransferase family protein [Anaerolineae bacterium]